MICQNCGAKNLENAENCSKCGAPISFIPLVPEEEPMDELISAKGLRKIVVTLIIIAILALFCITALFVMGIIGPYSALWSKSKNKNETSSKTVSTTAINTPYSENSAGIDTPPLTTTEFQIEISEVLPISEYELTESENSVKYVKQKTSNANLSKNISVGKSKLSFPASYSDIVKEGWTLADKKTTVGEYGSGFFSFRNNQGENITLRFVSKNGQRANIKDCEATAINLGYFVENNPDFKLSGISSESGLNDILSALGNPAEIEFAESSGLVYMRFDNKDSEHLYRLMLCFNLQSDNIKTADFYYYNLAN